MGRPKDGRGNVSSHGRSAIDERRRIGQEWLEHSSSRITLDTYTHLMRDEQNAADAVFARRPAAAPEQVN